MKIQYHNRSRLSPELEGDAQYVSFDELLANADVLSLNLALNAKTRHIIGEKEFQKIKDGVVIVNTARGALIDEKALVAALDSGKVSSILAYFLELWVVTECDRSCRLVWMCMRTSRRSNLDL